MSTTNITQTTPTRDWWVDGHHIFANTREEARAEAASLYTPHVPKVIRPWTDADQAELDSRND